MMMTHMGLTEWRAKRRIKDPVRGVFHRTNWYDKRGTTWLTGAITVQGIPSFAAEAPVDSQGKWTQTDDLPVVVDRSNPNHFAILWEEIVLQGPGAQALQSAEREAARLNAGGAPAPASPFGNPAGAAASFPDLENLGATQAWAQEMIQNLKQARGLPSSTGVTSQVFVNGQPVAANSPMVADALRMAEQALARAGGTMPVPGAAAPGIVRATATVRSVAEVPSAAPGGAADVTFDVQLPDGVHPATARITFTTPERRALVEPGASLPVLFNAATGWLVVDTSRLPSPTAPPGFEQPPDPAEAVAQTIMQGFGAGPTPSQLFLNGRPVAKSTLVSALQRVVEELEPNPFAPPVSPGGPDAEALAGELIANLGGGPAANGVSRIRINGEPVPWDTVAAALRKVIDRLRP